MHEISLALVESIPLNRKPCSFEEVFFDLGKRKYPPELERICVMTYKRAATIFTFFAVLFSDSMCVTVASSYRDLLWGGKYAGYSTPPSTAFLYAIPYLFGILLLLTMARYCRRRDDDFRRKAEEKDWDEIFRKADPLVKEYLSKHPRPDELVFIRNICRTCEISRDDALWVVREIRRRRNWNPEIG